MAAPAAGSRESVWPRFRNPLAWLFHGATKSFAEALQSAFQGVIDGQHPEPGAALQQDAVLCPGPPSPPGAPAAGPAVPWHSLQPQHSARNACGGQTGSIGRSSMPRRKRRKTQKTPKKRLDAREAQLPRLQRHGRGTSVHPSKRLVWSNVEISSPGHTHASTEPYKSQL